MMNSIEFVSGRKFAFIALFFIPWLLFSLLSGGFGVFSLFLLTLITSTTLGSILLKLLKLSLGVKYRLLLSMPMGFTVMGAVIAYAKMLALAPLYPLLGMYFVSLLGIQSVLRDLGKVRFKTNSKNWVVLVVSGLVSTLVYAPSAFLDGVETNSGAMQWMWVDSSYFFALAATLKFPGAPLVVGMLDEPLKYHFASHALSAALSRTFGVEIIDVVPRVTRGVALVAFVLSSIAFGRIVSAALRINRTITSYLTPAAVFFTATLISFFHEFKDSSSELSGSFFFTVPYVYPIQPIAHSVFGASGLWSLVMVTFSISMLLVARIGLDKTSYGMMLVPFLVFPFNYVVGIGVFGLYFLLLILGNPLRLNTILKTLFLMTLLVLSLILCGFVGHNFASNFTVELCSLVPKFERFSVSFLLGIPMLSFTFFSMSRKHNVLFLVYCVSFAGWMSFYFFTTDSHWNNNVYGSFVVYYILVQFSVVSIAYVLEKVRNKEIQSVIAWCLHTSRSILLVSGVIILIGTIYILVYGFFKTPTGESYDFVPKLYSLSFAVPAFIISFIILVLLRKSRLVMSFINVFCTGIVILAILSSIPWIMVYPMGQVLELEVWVDKAEVQAARWIRENTDEFAIFATDSDAFTMVHKRPYRKYVLRGLTERRVLYESWEYGEQFRPRFSQLKADNDTLFTTKDSSKISKIVEEYSIDYLMVTNPDSSRIRQFKKHGEVVWGSVDQGVVLVRLQVL